MKRLVIMIFTVCSAFLLVVPYSTMAKTASQSYFYIHLNPIYPQPYSSVKLSLSSNSISLINSTFSVLVDGKKVGTGTGSKSISFETGTVGKSMYVVVNVTSNGKVYTQTLTLHPASVALVIEPIATAPVWYLGIPTIPSFGKVRLVAIPNMEINGNQIDPSKLSYVWKIGNETLPISGVGRESAIINSPMPYRTNNISVIIHDSKNTQTAQQTLTLTPSTPVVRIYENNPLTGIDYEHSLSSESAATIGSTESTFAAVPYGFPLSNGGPSITWLLNGIKAQSGPLLTVRPKGIGTGAAIINALVQNSSTLADVSTQISIHFGSQKKNFGLFGL